MPEGSSLTKAKQSLRRLTNARKARVQRSFFKETDDVFLGVTTPQIRQLARQFQDLPFAVLRELMKSRVHDERSLAHAILIRKFERADARSQERIFSFYIRNRKFIRSWNGVDDSAPYIAGRYLLNRKKTLLYELARSKSLWDRRIAIVSTWWFIRNDQTSHTLKIVRMLLKDREDLIHKAAGWMLREVGKRDPAALNGFLHEHAHEMPRTMLRYAIERFPSQERIIWLQTKSLIRSSS
ncbi:MAG TPA: DNA alkylation repair protein [Verrucomicrobiae bacterium]|nr:DNA alkylation repair protein [Verrucomicrobiae bacterium]